MQAGELPLLVTLELGIPQVAVPDYSSDDDDDDEGAGQTIPHNHTTPMDIHIIVLASTVTAFYECFTGFPK